MTEKTDYHLFPEDEDELKYKLVRHFFGPPRSRTVLRTGLTLEEARAHMAKPCASSSTDKSDFARRLVAKKGRWYDTFEPQLPRGEIRRLLREKGFDV